MSNLDSRVTKLETANEQLRKTNSELIEKAERLESHNRKYNLRVFGLSKDAEKGNPTSYTNTLFQELFKGKLQTQPVVEVVHRVAPCDKRADDVTAEPESFSQLRNDLDATLSPQSPFSSSSHHTVFISKQSFVQKQV